MSCLCITTLCSNSFRFRLAAKPPSMPSLTRNVSTMVLMRRRNCETQVFLFSTWKDEKALCCKYREQSHIPLKEELIRVCLRSGFFKILVPISLQLLSGWWHQRHFHYWRERFSWKLDLFYKGIRPAIDGWSVRVETFAGWDCDGSVPIETDRETPVRRTSFSSLAKTNVFRHGKDRDRPCGFLMTFEDPLYLSLSIT